MRKPVFQLSCLRFRTLCFQLTVLLFWLPVGPPLARKGWTPAAAVAQPRRVDAAATAASQPHIARAQAAIEKKDWRLASEALNQAFAIKRRADVLYYLGLVALGQQRMLDAQDLMRRYLADPARIPEEAAATEAQRVISLARPPSGQVVVLGEAGAIVRIDDRLVGDLPLSHPLLLGPGEHRVVLAYKTTRQESPVLVPSGRVLEMRFKRGTGAVLISLRPAVLWPVAYLGVKEDAQNLFRDAAEQGALVQQQALLDVEAALPAEPGLGSCRTTLRCQRELAGKNQLEHVLDTSVSRSDGQGGSAFRIVARLFHTQVETPAAEVKKDCTACTAEQAAQLLKAATGEVLAHGLIRHPATLTVESVPDAAELTVDDLAVGRTPFSQPRWGGPVTLRARKAGFNLGERTVELKEGESATVRIELEAPTTATEPPPLSPRVTAPLRRPRWRLAVGGILIGAGVVIGGFGISALYVDGKCYSAAGIHECTSLLEPQYHSGVLGGALLGSGVGLSLIGSGMIAWPPSRPRNAK